MKPTICVLLLGLLGMASCHGISTLTAQSGGPGTTADWSKSRRQGTLIERIIISANEIPTDRPSGGVVMFSGDSVQLERMQRAQARRRGWTTSLSEGLRASTARHGTVAAVTNGRTLDPTESRRDLDGSLFDQVCA
ncbi:uncharacterized protein LOC120424627 [Culex pipiens pallens]|uniref:uncharacterized protein LOC120424627 n=1 Tax=Culex pipiens pallens TaxID=42434 RepID=UPI0019537BFB|nr:uncharacterized protein LOC120424627 [Culex pipiens pallens]